MKHFSIGFSFLIVVLFLFSCKEKEQVSPPVVGNVIPEAGVATMTVTISGSNFDPVRENNEVNFNGAIAKVLGASKDTLIVEVPQGGTTGSISVKTPGGTNTGPSFLYYDVYILMMENSGNASSKIIVWHNGEISNIESTPERVVATDIAVSGNDVYISGTQENAAVYWQNGSVVKLANDGTATGIAVSGSDVYVCGTERTYDPYLAKYWKNGEGVNLTESNWSEIVTDIFIENNSVYILGTIRDSPTLRKTHIWKDGVPSLINTAFASNTPMNLFVKNGDVYATGIGYESTNHLLMWKNGEEEVWYDGSSSLQTYGLTKFGDDVLVIGGDVLNGSIASAILWDNKNTIRLTDDSAEAYGKAITMVRNDRIIAGAFYTPKLTYPFFAVNDQIVFLTDGTARWDVIGMVAR